MKISVLLVEDDENKRDAIRDKLFEISSNIEIIVADNVKSAETSVRNKQFDLIIIDLVIPLSTVSKKPSRTGGLVLLEWLEDEPRKPSYIVGMSSFNDVAEEQASEFTDRSWHVLKYESSSTSWFEQLRALVVHISGTKQINADSVYQSDLLVITALRNPELAAILNLNWVFSPILQPVEGKQFVRLGQKSLQNGNKLSIAAGSTSKMGMVWTSLFTTNSIKKFRPRIVAMTGICMGHPSETSIGDIVVAVHSWNWQAGRLSARPDGSPYFESQPEPVVASKVLLNLWDDMAADSTLLEKIHNEYHGDKPPRPPKLKVAPMVSGSAVIAHESVHNDIFEQDRKIRAVDMETFGVYAACDSIEELTPLFFSVKSVSDLGLPDKEDKYQKFCAYASARALDLYLEKYWSTIVKASNF